MDKNVAVIGASGLIGSYLYDILSYSNNVNLVGTYNSNANSHHIPLDISKMNLVDEFFKAQHPDVVYLSSYISNVDKCEIDGAVRRVNIDGTYNVVNSANKYGARVVFLSSSYVFDGAKKSPYDIWDIPYPIQQYGIQKLICENMVLSSGKNMVVRTCGVIGKEDKRKNFAYYVIDKIKSRSHVIGYIDQFMMPIHAHTLSSCIIDLVDGGASGLFHINGEDEVSKFDFAVDIAREMGLPTSEVISSDSSRIYQPAKRPYNACLKNNISMKIDYGEMLGRFVDEN